MKTAFDGVWTSEPMTKATMDAALVKSDLDPRDFKPWFSDWTGVDYRTFVLTIKDGTWDEQDFNAGARDGGGEGQITSADASTLVVHDPGGNCDIPFKLNRSGEMLTIELGDDTCGAEDILLETAIYEATPFHFIQSADWTPPPYEPPIASASRPPDSASVSTSAQRLLKHPAGTVDGATLGYLEYLPPSYQAAGDKSPLLVFLHGSGESGKGTDGDLTALAANSLPGLISFDLWPDDRPFVVLAPQHDDQLPGEYCFTPAEVSDFLAFAQSTYNVDPSRIYLTGLSCGAIGLWHYLREHGNETIAAAVPIAGYGVDAFQKLGCELGKTPIWAFHGALDDGVPVIGDVYPISQLQACTGPAPVDARLTVFPLSGHDVWTRTYSLDGGPDIYEWMLSHHK